MLSYRTVLRVSVGVALCLAVVSPVEPAGAASPVATGAPSKRSAGKPVVKSASKGGVAGSLVSFEPLAAKVDAAKGYRVRYRSRALNGEPIEVTGAAFVPDGTPPPGGWPVLSVAHGTTGVADVCAPSNHLSFIEINLAKIFLALGIAVVQTDYEGLGTPGRHPYLVGRSEGRSVLDIARAARSLPGETVGSRVVVWGHSQGGHAALFAGELASTWSPDLQLLGVVAGAPPSEFTDVSLIDDSSPPSGFLVMLLAGLAAADPKLRLDAVFTPAGLAALPVVDTGCTGAVSKAFAGGPLSKFIKVDGLGSAPWMDALAGIEPGNFRTAAPLLIVHGDRDELVPVETSAVLTKRLCSLGDSVQRKVYLGANHAGAAFVSLADVQRFISDRFQGMPAPAGCG